MGFPAEQQKAVAVEVTPAELAARAKLLDAALAREYDLTGELNFTKRVLALAERGLEHPVSLSE